MTPLEQAEAILKAAEGLIALANVGEALRHHYCESAGSELDGGTQQDLLLAAGVIAEAPGGYSLERHGEQYEWDPEEGDLWYVETPSAYAARLVLEKAEPASLALALIEKHRALEEALELFRSICSAYENQDLNHVDFRVKCAEFAHAFLARQGA